jgi:opacity protein-like surface antigen
LDARIAIPLLALVVACAAVPPDAKAQTKLYAGGGASFPTGEFAEYSDTGWQVAGGVLFPLSDSGLALGVEAFYGSNGRKSDTTGITFDSPFGLVAILRYGLATSGSVEPYVSGGAGLHYMGTSGGDGTVEMEFGYQFGAGVGFDLAARTAVFVEGRYISV